MAKCEYCGAKFDPDEAEDIFESEHPYLLYENIAKCLCGECASKAIEDEEDGVYFETCEECGDRFDYILENAKFYSWTGESLLDATGGNILCASCAEAKRDD